MISRTTMKILFHLFSSTLENGACFYRPEIPFGPYDPQMYANRFNFFSISILQNEIKLPRLKLSLHCFAPRRYYSFSNLEMCFHSAHLTVYIRNNNRFIYRLLEIVHHSRAHNCQFLFASERHITATKLRILDRSPTTGAAIPKHLLKIMVLNTVPVIQRKITTRVMFEWLPLRSPRIRLPNSKKSPVHIVTSEF